MGKCSGLKGGGHHRKALDIAEKKKTEKAARKKEQSNAGERAVSLQQLLTTLDPDADIYLEGGEDEDMGDLCRAYFRFDHCSNRRCKFSHAFSIADALGNIMNGGGMDGVQESSTIPALRVIPGMRGEESNTNNRRRQKHHRSLPPPILGAAGFFDVVPEGSIVMNTIITFLESEQDVFLLKVSCRYIHALVSDCREVQRRERKAKEMKLGKRNDSLLGSKALSGRLRYAVSYVDCKSSGGSSKKTHAKNDRNNKSRYCGENTVDKRLRPILVYDYENPNVFRAFQQAGLSKNKECP